VDAPDLDLAANRDTLVRLYTHAGDQMSRCAADRDRVELDSRFYQAAAAQAYQAAKELSELTKEEMQTGGDKPRAPKKPRKPRKKKPSSDEPPSNDDDEQRGADDAQRGDSNGDPAHE